MTSAVGQRRASTSRHASARSRPDSAPRPRGGSITGARPRRSGRRTQARDHHRDDAASARVAARRCRAAPRAASVGRAREAARLERERADLGVLDRAEDGRRRHREHASQPAARGCSRCRSRVPAARPRPSGRARASAARARAPGGRRTSAAPVRRVPRATRRAPTVASSGRTGRGPHAIANTRTTTCAPNARPSSVTSNGPTSATTDPPPGSKSTLTRSTLTASGSDEQRRVAEDEPQSTRATADGTTTPSPMRQAGPDDAVPTVLATTTRRDDRQPGQRVEPVPGGRARPADRGRQAAAITVGRLSARSSPSVEALRPVARDAGSRASPCGNRAIGPPRERAR